MLFATPWRRERSETVSLDLVALEGGNAFSLGQRLRFFDGTSSGQGIRKSHIPHRSNYKGTAGADIERQDPSVGHGAEWEVPEFCPDAGGHCRKTLPTNGEA